MSLTWAGFLLGLSGAACVSMSRYNCVPEVAQVFAILVGVLAMMSGIGLIAIARRDRKK